MTKPAPAITIRPAALQDVQKIHDLLKIFAEKHLLLPRPQLDLIERIGNFTVAELENGAFAGCSALRDYGNGLFEIRSLAVPEKFQRRGVATLLVENQIRNLRSRASAFRLFALTYRIDFFQNLGFRVVDKSLFPEKIWSDCERCPKKEHCDETAVLMNFPRC